MRKFDNVAQVHAWANKLQVAGQCCVVVAERNSTNSEHLVIPNRLTEGYSVLYLGPRIKDWQNRAAAVMARFGSVVRGVAR